MSDDREGPHVPSGEWRLALLLLFVIASGVCYFVARDIIDRQPVDPRVAAGEAIRKAQREQAVDQYLRTGVWVEPK